MFLSDLGISVTLRLDHNRSIRSSGRSDGGPSSQAPNEATLTLRLFVVIEETRSQLLLSTINSHFLFIY